MHIEYTSLLKAKNGSRSLSRSASSASSRPSPDTPEPDGYPLDDRAPGAETSRIWEKGQFWDYVDDQLLQLYTAANNDYPNKRDRHEFIDEYVIYFIFNHL
jgi:hypothetical protein